MNDYEHKSISEVQSLAKQGDKDALFEMAWRIELLPDSEKNNPVERCAWQDYWFEKAADAGNIESKGRYACSLAERILNEEDRKKALKYFHSLEDDYKNGKTDAMNGALAYFWLGVMYCEGYYTERDAVRGKEYIKKGASLSNGYEKFGYKFFDKLGQIYSLGLVQLGEEPSIADLELAVKFFGTAIICFNPERGDPRRFEFTKQQLKAQEERIIVKKELLRLTGQENLIFSGADERRRKMMEVTGEAKQRLDADKAAFAKIRQRYHDFN